MHLEAGVTSSLLNPAAADLVLHNEDLLWIVVSYMTGFETSRISSRRQRPSNASASPILPLLLTFRSLRRTRMAELSIPLLSMKSQFVTSVPMVEWAVSMGCLLDVEFTIHAARMGSLEVLQWMRCQDPPCPLSMYTCSEAAAGGHLGVLQC